MKIDNNKKLQRRIAYITESQWKPDNKNKFSSKTFFILVLTLALGGYAFYSITQPVVSISADKMNVFYIGLQNPITVAVAGVSPDKVTLESEKVKFIDKGGGRYFVTAMTPGKAVIQVNIENREPQFIDFRVKRIPDPMAMLGRSYGGSVKVEEFLEYSSVDPVIFHFEYDAACKITAYTATHVAKGKEPVEAINTGSVYEAHTQEMLKKVKAGDIVYFDNVKCKCPGDAASRPLNSMVFQLR